MLLDYTEFLNRKKRFNSFKGFDVPHRKLNKFLFPFQRDIVSLALRKGKFCLFEDCGLGKTIQQLEWANQINKKTKEPIIILAPLAISRQTKMEGERFDINVNIVREHDDIVNGINITNYEKLHKFKNVFSGVVLDESSILKNMSGFYRNEIIDFFKLTDYKLACTATPSPNDYMELGNHAEFLGVMSYTEMLSMFFVNDSGDVGKWRLKKHAKEKEFWRWVCDWSIMVSHPRDLGYDQDGFDLPELSYHEHIIRYNGQNKGFGLFTQEASTLNERRKIRKETIEKRCEYTADLVNGSKGQFLIWCGLNKESELLSKLIDQSEEITGSQDHDIRAEKMLGFANKEVKRLITKPSIAGFGMNWQNCNKAVFVGLSDSWEELYQAIRRIYRFGQKRNVDIHIVIEEREGKVLKNIRKKDKQASHMIKNMIQFTKEFIDLEKTEKECDDVKMKKIELPNWLI